MSESVGIGWRWIEMTELKFQKKATRKEMTNLSDEKQ